MQTFVHNFSAKIQENGITGGFYAVYSEFYTSKVSADAPEAHFS